MCIHLRVTKGNRVHDSNQAELCDYIFGMMLRKHSMRHGPT